MSRDRDCLTRGICKKALYMETKTMAKERNIQASWGLEITDPFNSMRLNMVF